MLSLEVDTSFYSNYKYYKCFIGHLNPDCINDTLIASPLNDYSLMPKFIVWGKRDSVNYDSTCVYDTLMVDTTEFAYPDFTDIKGSFFLNTMNYDTLPDIVFFLKWKTNDTLNPQDTSRLMCIFGQPQIDTIRRIFLNNVDTVQNSPFFVRNLRDGFGLKNYTYINTNQITSYIKLML